ncbi:MAG: hypothetical protein A2Z21_08780 [Candidatus Fraserbacteria bacterium RBG_16_55_9]|uniref:Indoleamine 2,3-dioxygenase n=1 Tax=Fraserbacteria sp. (strain RBG_16_55_9) TaxID=1817864 RepID=A0A1F5V0E2_FRAXR|nr:MAG: hypothetical protein A2Z21_08780 [Candidatus Fraserbacteria bacterium RBG_16_55_9]
MRGFLPTQDPLEKLPRFYEVWDSLGADLAALLMTGRLRRALERLPLLSIEKLRNGGQRERAILILSVLANAYVWADAKPATRIPKSIAVPLCQLAGLVGRPPITTYASIVLNNWRRLDEAESIELSNLACRQLFVGGLDEQWFYLISVEIEAKGAPALSALVATQQAISAGRADDVWSHLKTVASVIGSIRDTLMRMYENCDPHIFYYRIRPYLTGWNAPGVVYEGVTDKPLKFYGGSAAQSPLIQALDAALGVRHTDQDTNPYLLEMRRYMSPRHRQFIEAVERGPSIRQFVLDRQGTHEELCAVYNGCVRFLEEFRRKHMEMAVRYITHPAPKGGEAQGTGGTKFSVFLGKAVKETRDQLIE